MNALGSYALDTVYNVDALTLLKGLPDGSIDLVVTSPPYDSLRTYNGYSFDFEPIARETFRVMKQGGVLVWVVGDSVVNGSETLTSFKQALYFVECGFRMHQRIIWQKDGIPHLRPKAYLPDFEDMFVLAKGEPKTFNPIMKLNKNAGEGHKNIVGTSKGYKTSVSSYVIREQSILGNVWIVRAGSANNDDRTGHPAVFPEQLAERHILTWSNAGDVVADFFGGSGTTAKMARNNGRHWLTNDISAEYCDLMRRRLALPYTMPMFAQEASHG